MHTIPPPTFYLPHFSSTASVDGAAVTPPELSVAHHQKHTSLSKNPPWALAQRLAVELSYLQSLDHASLMLSGVEKSRAVGLAQMEAVTLAQHLRVCNFTRIVQHCKS